ncbi:DNA internalization-related competence protein ComEC/Rec2 [Cohnella pontilimi]|uniref:DNA internalization-related competence protein ComEC/Rec2 n=1 Tax=Cohnella pontilimi TaxID=2564100 RepID=A0A4U0FF91_9BACL|nr:DNA internalization-related competence protein ComEC/Rec2 [Cohnella pontilimi]TJY43480.1 DNA internalization-related competence protein ComEC/Rec2 [Cohnella pontilimi]
MNRRPLVAFVCCWLTGVSIPSLWQGGTQFVVLAAAALLLIAARLVGRINGRLAAACVLALLLAFGERMLVDNGRVSDLSALWETEQLPIQADVTGRLSTGAQVDGDVATFQMSASGVRYRPSGGVLPISEPILVRVKLKTPDEQIRAARWKRGDLVKVSGAPERPADAGNFGAFDYKRYLERQGVYWIWSVQGADGVIRQDAAVPILVRPLRAVDELRTTIGGLTDRLYPGDDAGYMKGLVAGITEDIDPAQYDAFSRLGLTHILAISGLHVAVVVFIILRLAALAGLTRERAIDLAFSAMPVYMLLTGASPSAVRACLTAMIALAMARRHQLKDGLHLLAAAALIMTVWDPHTVENVSFQLSFAVTAGLLLFTPLVTGLLSFIPSKMFRETLAVGMTAQIVSFPLSAYYFHGLHLLSLPANLVLVPFISFVVLPLGMASVALGAAWFPLGWFPAKLASYANILTFEIVRRMDEWQGLRTVWPQTAWLWVIAAFGLLLVSASLLRRREAFKQEQEWSSAELEKETVPLGTSAVGSMRMLYWRLAVVLLCLLWTGWLVWGYRPVWLDRDAYVQFLDVGQGDAILIRTGKGRHILIDTGGTVTFRKPDEAWRERHDPYEVGRKLLVPLLRQRGVRELDALVLTHLDNDHIGGAEAVIRGVPVRAVIWNGTRKPGQSAERLLHLIRERGIPLYAARQGMKWQADASCELEVLYPGGSSAPPLLASIAEQNLQSVVLMINLYGRRFLFPGDLESSGEAEVVEAASHRSTATSSRTVDVLKAAHHGSKTSTGALWLHYWKPAQVVVSVGRRNLYGHPHETVVARIRDAGIPMFRTDRDGEIQYRIRPDGALQRRQKR